MEEKAILEKQISDKVKFLVLRLGNDNIARLYKGDKNAAQSDLVNVMKIHINHYLLSGSTPDQAIANADIDMLDFINLMINDGVEQNACRDRRHQGQQTAYDADGEDSGSIFARAEESEAEQVFPVDGA